MRTVNASAQALRQARGHLIEIPMVWLSARNRETHEVEGVGLWQGADVETILVTDMFTGVATSRVFSPAGMLEVGSVRHEAGLNIRPVEVKLSAISDEVLIAFRQYESRGALVQGFRRIYDKDWTAVAVEGWFKGFVNRAPSERPTTGGEASLSVDVVSTARTLTITSGAKKSHEAQKRRLGDMFRQYKGSTATWDLAWGGKDLRE